MYFHFRYYSALLVRFNLPHLTHNHTQCHHIETLHVFVTLFGWNVVIMCIYLLCGTLFVLAMTRVNTWSQLCMWSSAVTFNKGVLWFILCINSIASETAMIQTFECIHRSVHCVVLWLQNQLLSFKSNCLASFIKGSTYHLFEWF